MEYTEHDYKRETIEHINEVRQDISKIISELSDRARTHDTSKFSSPELEMFTLYAPKLKNSVYGSDEYNKNLEGVKEALVHHYKNNRDHPESHQDGIRGMNLVDIIEMFCDWNASANAHEHGDIKESIEINQKRFKYSDDLKQIFLNSIDLFN